MTNQTTAITPYSRLKSIVQSDDVQARFKALLDKNSPAFLASLLSVVGNNKYLMECDPGSILTAAAKAAVLRLPVEAALGFGHIVPFKGTATFVIGYKGLIQLALRSGMYEAINATEIYQGEEIKIDRLSGRIVLNGKRTGDAITGYVSYFKLKNGFEKHLYMSVPEIEAHAKKYSKSYGFDSSAWKTNFDAMAKKTVLRLLLGKYGLLSIDIMDDDDVSLHAAGAAADDPRFAIPNFDNYLEGEVTDVTDAPPAQDELLQATVADGSFENIHEARNAFKRCKTDWTTFDGAKAWARAYRAWREMDAKPEKAAEYANNGEMPK